MEVGCSSFTEIKQSPPRGGAVITNKKKLADRINHLANTAKIKHNWEYIHDDVGYNFKLPSINAALGIAQLEKLQIFLKAKESYSANIQKFKDISGVSIFKEGKHLRSNYWLQTLILDKKHRFLKNKILKYCFQKNFIAPILEINFESKTISKETKMNLIRIKRNN